MGRRVAGDAIDEASAVFVSYSREASAQFVAALKPRLEADLGVEVWLDREDIPPAAMWRDEVGDGIERCDAMIVLLSPHAAASAEVGVEIARAHELGKRIVPVVHRDVEPSRTPAPVRDRHWIFWRSGDDGEEALASIERALTIDPKWTKAHKDLNASVLAWERHGRDRHQLLRGPALAAAEAAVAVVRDPSDQPQATPLMHEFVAASRREATRRQRRLVVSALVVAAVSLTLAVLAVLAKFDSDRQRAEAERQRQTAVSTALAAQAKSRFGVEPDLAALLALEAFRTKDTVDALGGVLHVVDTPTTFRDRVVVHTGVVTAVAVHPPTGTAATADSEGRIAVWDVTTGGDATVRPDPIETGRPIDTVAFAGGGDRLVVAGGGAAETWSTTRPGGERVAVHPVGDVVTVSSDGGLVVGLEEDDGGGSTLTVTEFGGDRPLAAVAVDLTHAALDPDGDGESATLPVASRDGARVAFGMGSELHVWRWDESGGVDVIAMDDLVIADGGRSVTTITSLTFLGDGDVLAVGIDEGDIYVVDTGDPVRPVASRATPAPTNEPLALAATDAGDVGDGGGGAERAPPLLVSAHNNGEIKVWELDGLAARELATLRGHDEEARAVAIAPSLVVASGSFDGDVIWSSVVPSSSIAAVMGGPDGGPSHGADVLAVEFAGSRLWSLDRDDVLSSWDPATGEMNDPDLGAVWAFDAEGDRLLIGDEDGGLALIEITTGSTTVPDRAHADLEGVEIAGDGGMFVSVSTDTAWIWDGPARFVAAVDLPRDFEISSTTFPSSDVLWIGGDVPAPAGLADPDDETVALAVRVDTSSGAVLQQAFHNDDEFGHRVSALAVSDDGTILATGGSDRRIFLWDAGDVERPTHELAVHVEEVSDVVFVGDDVMLSGDADGRILMWDVDAARPVGELTGPTDAISALDLSPDGAWLAAGGQDDEVWLWDLRLETWLAAACDLAGRNMTQAEWDRFGLRGDPVRHCGDHGPPGLPLAAYPGGNGTG